MRYRAKTRVRKGAPFPIWVEGRYTTEPPRKPGSSEYRPKGHYIDRGGYPGANVYEIDIETLCRGSGAEDLSGDPIFENDLVRFMHLDEEGKVACSYCVAMIGSSGELEVVDFMTGEVMGQAQGNRLKVIGNVFDDGSFMEDMERIREDSGDGRLPYVPAINVQHGPYPYWRLQCRECGRLVHGLVFTTRCGACGGFVDCTLATAIQKESLSG
ncbi:MAG: hypothetical protein NC331_13995 [Lachnospiraceae bacterium]|nr:hypothetical protein [Lachnospiraceae bacterium]MCM1240476.1 hypothetical protein [Lachnospiraceae bacterium]